MTTRNVIVVVSVSDKPRFVWIMPDNKLYPLRIIESRPLNSTVFGHVRSEHIRSFDRFERGKLTAPPEIWEVICARRKHTEFSSSFGGSPAKVFAGNVINNVSGTSKSTSRPADGVPPLSSFRFNQWTDSSASADGADGASNTSAFSGK